MPPSSDNCLPRRIHPRRGRLLALLTLVVMAHLVACPGEVTVPSTTRDLASMDAAPDDVSTRPDQVSPGDHAAPDRKTAPDLKKTPPPKCGSCKVSLGGSLASKSATPGAVSGGKFTGAGWQSTSLGSRLVFDMGKPVHCGVLEVQVTQFNPPMQYNHKTAGVNCAKVDCYLHFVSLYEQTHGNHHKASKANETQVALQATSEGSHRDSKIKFKIGACSWNNPACGGGTKYTQKYAWNPAHTYKLKIKWTYTGATFWVDGKQQGHTPWSWPASHAKPTPGLRHIFLGRDKNIAGGYLKGPVYSQLKVQVCN